MWDIKWYKTEVITELTVVTLGQNYIGGHRETTPGVDGIDSKEERR